MYKTLTLYQAVGDNLDTCDVWTVLPISVLSVIKDLRAEDANDDAEKINKLYLVDWLGDSSNLFKLRSSYGNTAVSKHGLQQGGRRGKMAQNDRRREASWTELNRPRDKISWW